LRPFAFEDHKFFFGRERQTYALYRLIDRSPFVTVVGSSGSGKSSLVNAGLLPLLEEESGDQGGRTWRWLIVRPGDAPLARLAEGLASLSTDTEPRVAAARRERISFDLRSSLGIAEALKRIDGLEGTSLFLVVDQFEELFRYSSNPARDRHGTSRARDDAARFVQLLLEASRNAALNVHILLTMRSDFIGDCARFHGLPEAVSAAQYLVPALTRDQREEVIRGPIEDAGASIDPALVETLLNDSSEDLDQLPVLQHCLLRLWKHAGRAAPKTDANADAANSDEAKSAGAPRHLTIEQYDAIDRMGGALSRHAEEILAELAGLDLTVEQAFRALAEIDREGREIRRPLLFSRLLAETGMTEAGLRRVLDRFSADDCSFLVYSLPTPAPSGTAIPPSDWRIDVGHEALLRRWERVSGRPRASAPGSGDAVSIGWLRAEEKDGQRYRSLRTRLESDPSATLDRKELHDALTWWGSRPRTAAWAERYGGGIEGVERLLSRSQTWKRIRFWGTAASVAAVAIFVATFSYREWQFKQNEQTHVQEREKAERNRAKDREVAQRSLATALKSATTLLNGLLESLNNGSTSAKGAERMMQAAQDIVKDVRTAEKTPETAALEVSLWLVASDVYLTLGQTKEQRDEAIKARDTASNYLLNSPNDPKWLSLLYASLLRVGDVLPELGRTPQNLEGSMAAYRQAADVARALAAGPEKDRWDNQVAFILGKIGDIWKISGDPTKALESYQAAVDVLAELTKRNPNSWLGYKSAAINRVGEALSGLGRYDEALAQFRMALEIRENRPGPRDDIYHLNVALYHTNIGRALRDQGNLDQALAELDKARTIRETLLENDRNNALWQSDLADTYGIKGAMLLKQDKKNAPEVLEIYRKAYALRRGLALRDAASAPRQDNARNAGDRLGKLLIEQKRSDEAIEVYRSVLETETKRPTKPDDYVKQRRLAELHVMIGDLLAEQDKAGDAFKDYQAALGIIMTLAARLPPDDAKMAEWASLRQSTEEKARKVAPTN